MRILHTADWHLGKRLEAFSRHEEQREVLVEICEIAEREKVDAVLIAGDLYDAFNPPTEAIELFYRTLTRLSNGGRRAVVATAGNHDSPERIEAPDSLARGMGILFAGTPRSEIAPLSLDTGLKVLRSAPGFVELKLPACEAPLRLLLAPYANQERMRTFLGTENEEDALRVHLQNHWTRLSEAHCDDKGVNLLLAHLFFMKKGGPVEDEGDEERPIALGGAQVIHAENVPGGIGYVACGHLHRKQNVGSPEIPIMYASSPLAYGFAEADQTKFVMILDAEPGQAVSWREIPLTKGLRLLRHRAPSVDEAVTWLGANPEAWVELTVESERYLTAEDRKRLQAAHPRIVHLIPVSKGSEESDARPALDLGRSTEDLFEDFFKSRRDGLEPDGELLGILGEALAMEEEER